MSGPTRSNDDDRLDQIIDMLTRFAGGDLEARVSPSSVGDQLDVVATGLNMLAEELAWRLEEDRAAREDLEEEVTRRTAELEEKTRTVEAQNRTILQLSTPVLQVWEGILVVPVVGAIDMHRAAQIMDSLLHSIERTQAAAVILDITGVPVVDTAVADHFLQTVRASRILGAEAILTGISPQNAQTLVRLGVDLSEIVTTGSLQAGLKRALQIVSDGT